MLIKLIFINKIQYCTLFFSRFFVDKVFVNTLKNTSFYLLNYRERRALTDYINERLCLGKSQINHLAE